MDQSSQHLQLPSFLAKILEPVFQLHYLTVSLTPASVADQ